MLNIKNFNIKEEKLDYKLKASFYVLGNML